MKFALAAIFVALAASAPAPDRSFGHANKAFGDKDNNRFGNSDKDNNGPVWDNGNWYNGTCSKAKNLCTFDTPYTHRGVNVSCGWGDLNWPRTVGDFCSADGAVSRIAHRRCSQQY